MKRISIITMIMGMLVFAASYSFAEIRVISVKGTAAYKAGGQWVPLQAGAALTAGTKVSTGVRSTAVIKINNHTVTVNPLTIMKISESRDDATSSNTRIGLRRGSVHAKVARNSRIKTVFKVSTPVATSSVRGTQEIIIYSPTFGMKIIVLDGTVEGSGLNSLFRRLSGDKEFQQKANKGIPDSLLSGLDDFLGKSNIQFVTLDEETALELFGEDFLSYTSAGRQVPETNFYTGPVKVSISLIWP